MDFLNVDPSDLADMSTLSPDVLWRVGNEAWFQMHAGEGDTLFFGAARRDVIRAYPASVLAYFSHPSADELRLAQTLRRA